MLNRTISLHFKISFIFFILALLFGFLYSLNLLGIGVELLPPTYTLSLHISLMLYGFPPLMLSMLPFTLFNRDKLEDIEGLRYLNIYFIIWYIFLIFMIISLVFGNQRGLAFYDYPYLLNFLLSFSGIFYLIAILKYIRHYKVKPLWVKVSILVIIISPFLLILLMNPQYGQVEKMAMGPHGDNTLGMSFVLLVLYYLTIKLHSKIDFKPRFHILWIIPLISYISSVVYRITIDSLTYNQEWFLQWLTLLYIPTLYLWLKDAKLRVKDNIFLYISIWAFIFVDVEGNILFIPQIRHLFHRDDLVVGHAHIAVGISMLFLSFSIVKNYFTIKNRTIISLATLLSLIALVLTISGFSEVGFIDINIESMWILRSIFGFIFISIVIKFYISLIDIKVVTKLDFYHLIGFFSDAIGAILLILFAPILYSLIDAKYTIGYQSVIYGFMFAVGLIHLLGLIKKRWSVAMAYATITSRIMASSILFALYISNILDWIALVVSLYDLIYALLYIIIFYGVEDEIYK